MPSPITARRSQPIRWRGWRRTISNPTVGNTKKTTWDTRLMTAPELPQEVVDGTRQRYEEAFMQITGEPVQAWLERTAA